MYRVSIKPSGTYAVELDDDLDEEAIENIVELSYDGDPIVIVEDIENFNEKIISMLERNEVQDISE